MLRLDDRWIWDAWTADDGERIRVALKTNDALFQTERATIYTRLVEGRFPPYQQFVPKKFAVSLPVSVPDLFDKCRQAGVTLRHVGDPVLYVHNPPGVSTESRRAMLDSLAELNRKSFEAVGDPETQTRISQDLMAIRMQSLVPDLTDLSREARET